jgi:hypothetical protein
MELSLIAWCWLLFCWSFLIKDVCNSRTRQSPRDRSEEFKVRKSFSGWRGQDSSIGCAITHRYGIYTGPRKCGKFTGVAPELQAFKRASFKDFKRSTDLKEPPGSVYVARHIPTNQMVVVKELVFKQEGSIARALNEYTAMRLVAGHFMMPQVLGRLSASDRMYIFQKYEDSINLGTLITIRHNFRLGHIYRVFSPMTRWLFTIIRFSKRTPNSMLRKWFWVLNGFIVKD